MAALRDDASIGTDVTLQVRRQDDAAWLWAARHERLALYAIVLFLPILPLRTVGPVRLFDLLFIPLLLMWGVRKLSEPYRILFRSCFRGALHVLLAGAIIATAFASDKSGSLYGIVIFVRFYLYFRVALDVIDDVSQVRTLLALMSIGLVFSAALGVAQGLLGFNITLLEADLNANTSADIGGQRVIRTVGTFANSLNFANYLSVTAFTLIAVTGPSRARRAVVVALAVIAFIALLQTLSRGPILAALIGALAYWGVALRRRKLIVPAIAAIAALSLMMLPVLGSQVAQSVLGRGLVARFAQAAERYEMDVRYTLWTQAAINWDSHVVGVGLRNSDYRVSWPRTARAVADYFPYETRGWKPFNFHFENVYIAMYMNVGLLGLIGFLLLIYKAIAVPLAMFRTRAFSGSGERAARVFMAANLTFAINMITNPSILGDVRIMVLFWTLLSGVAALAKLQNPQVAHIRVGAAGG